MTIQNTNTYFYKITVEFTQFSELDMKKKT
jgi:hypothetical protein